MVNADETTWKKVRTVPVGGVDAVRAPAARGRLRALLAQSPSPSPVPSATRSASVARKVSPQACHFEGQARQLKFHHDGDLNLDAQVAQEPVDTQAHPPPSAPSPHLMIDTEYFFSGSGSRSKGPIKVHVTRQSVESFASYDAKSTQ